MESPLLSGVGEDNDKCSLNYTNYEERNSSGSSEKKGKNSSDDFRYEKEKDIHSELMQEIQIPLDNDTKKANQNNNKQPQKKDEHYRLGGRSPLVTLFALLAGPLLSQLTNSVYGLVDSLWISKSHGTFGLKVLSSIFLFDYITFAFGEFLLISVSTKMSYLFGKKKEKEASQVVVDLFRFCFVLGIILPASILPIVKIVTKWVSDDDEVAEAAFWYMVPLLAASCSDLTYLLGIGVLQGEGRTLLSGTIQILSLMCNMLVFDPIFLFKCKFGVWGAALSTVVSEAIPGITLMCFILSGKFSLKFKASMFLKKPSKHSYSALKIGFASFMLNLSSAVPEFALQKFMAMTASAIGQLSPILALWDTFSRLYEMGLAIMYAFDGSFLPSASYAYGRRLYKRFIKLAGHTLWITVVWCGIFSAVLCLFPAQIASLWSKDESFLYWAKELFPIGYCTLCLWPFSSISISFLEASNFPGRASLLSVVTTFVPLPLASVLLYYLGPRDPRVMFTAYICDDVGKLFISLIIILQPLIMIKKAKEGCDIPNHPDEKEEEDEDDVVRSQSTLASVTSVASTSEV